MANLNELKIKYFLKMSSEAGVTLNSSQFNDLAWEYYSKVIDGTISFTGMDDSESQRLLLDILFQPSYTTVYSETTRNADGIPTRRDYWEDNSKANKLMEDVYTLNGDGLKTQSVLTDLVTGATKTSVFVRDADGLETDTTVTYA